MSSYFEDFTESVNKNQPGVSLENPYKIIIPQNFSLSPGKIGG